MPLYEAGPALVLPEKEKEKEKANPKGRARAKERAKVAVRAKAAREAAKAVVAVVPEVYKQELKETAKTGMLGGVMATTGIMESIRTSTAKNREEAKKMRTPRQ